MPSTEAHYIRHGREARGFGNPEILSVPKGLRLTVVYGGIGELKAYKLFI